MTDHLADLITNQTQTGVDAGAVASAQAGRERPVTDLFVQAWLARHADLKATRLDALVEDALTNPQLWMETITPPPPDGHARGPWRAAMRQVVAYRDRYQVTDAVTPLGPPAPEGERGEAYAAAARILDAITTGQEPAWQLRRPVQRPMDRVPAVLADARARATQLRHDANERARRDAADRASQQNSGWGW